jgi:predicted anti-sigma-YlaC factor YlaD
MRIFGCSKFKKLASEALDRHLTPSEEAFVQRHRSACPECHDFQSQSSMAMNFLRSATIDVEVHPMFEERVIRKLRVQTTRESLRYWSPALAGAFIAGLAVVAALQMITRSADLPHVRFPGSEAHRVTNSKSNPLDQNIDPTTLNR